MIDCFISHKNPSNGVNPIINYTHHEITINGWYRLSPSGNKPAVFVDDSDRAIPGAWGLAGIFVEACEDHMFEILPDAVALLRYAIKVIQYHTFVFFAAWVETTDQKAVNQHTVTPHQRRAREFAVAGGSCRSWTSVFPECVAMGPCFFFRGSGGALFVAHCMSRIS